MPFSRQEVDVMSSLWDLFYFEGLLAIIASRDRLLPLIQCLISDWGRDVHRSVMIMDRLLEGAGIRGEIRCRNQSPPEILLIAN